MCAPACDANTCNGHGTCDDSTGATACSCWGNYVGADCKSCDDGLQDNDHDGKCFASCQTWTCNDHGTCDDSSGWATCTCTSEYTGTTCKDCAQGYQDNNFDYVCQPACAVDSCSGGHGKCSDASGKIVCSCGPGYVGNDCEKCDLDYQDKDNDGSCLPACSPSACPGHSACDDSSGTIKCSCTGGYTGADCSTCSASSQDNDNDGNCQPACDANTCNGNGTCDDSSGTATCTCVAGKGGPNCDFDQVYGLNLPTNAAYAHPADVLYDIDNSSAASPFTRVGYRLTLGTETVWVALDAFTTDRSLLGVPVDALIQGLITNVTVVSNAKNTPSIATPSNGRIEFWSNCYAQAGGNGNAYDYFDTPTDPDCYGSMQISVGTNTVFGYNSWANGQDADLGFGNNPNGEPDWTFAHNAGDYAVRRLEVYVK
jgi:hypothetical protein